MTGRKRCLPARFSYEKLGGERVRKPRNVGRKKRRVKKKENKIRVGLEYQAVIPELRPDSPGRYNDTYEESMLLWCPNDQLSDTMLDEYLSIARDDHGYNMQQGLGMLQWNNYNVERSLADLADFTPIPEEEWTVEDKVLFDQAFSFHKKDFQLIQQMLPHKPISSLVKYYYSWKKTRTRTSVVDRQDRRLINSDDELESKKEALKQKPSSASNDKAVQSRSGPVKKESIGAKYRHHPLRARRRLPKGMHLEQRDITSLSASHDAGVLSIPQLDPQLVSLKTQVQSITQTNSILKQSLNEGVDSSRTRLQQLDRDDGVSALPPRTGHSIITMETSSQHPSEEDGKTRKTLLVFGGGDNEGSFY